MPKPITAVIAADGKVTEVIQGEVNAEALAASVLKAQNSIVYEEGDLCPQFTLQTYTSAGAQAGEFSASDCLGKVTVLNFWYTNCDPCKEELPFFNTVLKDMHGEINMYAIHSSSAIPVGGVQKWIDENSDKNGLPWRDYNIIFAQDTKEVDLYSMLGGRSAFPMTVIVNAQGRITKVIQGACSEQALRQAIEQAK